MNSLKLKTNMENVYFVALSLVVPLSFTIVSAAELMKTISEELKVDGAMEDNNAAPTMEWLDSMKTGSFFASF